MKTMTDLFTMDPMDMTNEDIDSIIKHFRENRQKFLQNPTALRQKKSSKPKATDGINIDIKI